MSEREEKPTIDEIWGIYIERELWSRGLKPIFSSKIIRYAQFSFFITAVCMLFANASRLFENGFSLGKVLLHLLGAVIASISAHAGYVAFFGGGCIFTALRMEECYE